MKLWVSFVNSELVGIQKEVVDASMAYKPTTSETQIIKPHMILDTFFMQ